MTMDNTTAHAVAVRPASYGYGTILTSAADEARKSTQGRRMIRERVMALGKHSIYNLTGLVRTFPLQPQDLEPLENQFTYYTHFLGRAEELALHYTGANPHTCSAVLCNRVSAAMLAIMLGTLKPGDRVLSPCPLTRGPGPLASFGATGRRGDGCHLSGGAGAGSPGARHARRRLAYAGHHTADAVYVPPASRRRGRCY